MISVLRLSLRLLGLARARPPSTASRDWCGKRFFNLRTFWPPRSAAPPPAICVASSTPGPTAHACRGVHRHGLDGVEGRGGRWATVPAFGGCSGAAAAAEWSPRLVIDLVVPVMVTGITSPAKHCQPLLPPAGCVNRSQWVFSRLSSPLLPSAKRNTLACSGVRGTFAGALMTDAESAAWAPQVRQCPPADSPHARFSKGDSPANHPLCHIILTGGDDDAPTQMRHCLSLPCSSLMSKQQQQGAPHMKRLCVNRGFKTTPTLPACRNDTDGQPGARRSTPRSTGAEGWGRTS